MGRPQGNGLIEMVDEKSNDRGFACMKLIAFMTEDYGFGSIPDEIWQLRHQEARDHQCAYRDRCPVYARTIVKRGKTPVQLSLF